MGIYVTTDGAKSWSVLGTDLPITFVHDIAIHERDKTMVIATHGRGIWKIGIRNIDRKLKKPFVEDKPEKK
jgi:hypothetical protein